METSLELYENENYRADSVGPLLGQLIDCSLGRHQTQNGAQPDGVSNVGEFFPLIAEYKNEIGSGGTDGSIQVGLGHSKWAAQKKVSYFVLFMLV